MRKAILAGLLAAAAGRVRGRTAVVHTTGHHPVWDATVRQWVNAGDLMPGHRLVGPDGQSQYVVAVNNYVGAKEMRNLTVAAIHTYYVIAGSIPVLVHNCGDALKHSESHLADSLDGNTYFHYTDEAGHDAIMNGGVVNANSKGVSYFTQDMVPSGDANNVLFAGNPAYAGRGSHVIAFRMPEGVLQPGVQPNEMVHIGSFRFSPDDVIYHGPNPFG